MHAILQEIELQHEQVRQQSKVDKKKSSVEEHLRSQFKDNFSINPAEHWDCSYHQRKNFSANRDERKELTRQTQVLLEKKLIRPSNSRHSSAAFLVNNHLEQVRGEPQMCWGLRIN